MTIQSKIYYLSILAIFKNEAHILEEWINIHLKEGVEHFYLINNNSIDNYMVIIEKYKNYITLKHENGIVQQLNAYCSFKEQIINETNWIAIIDLDEFVFSSKKDTQLVDYIKDYELKGAQGIYIPWIMYGSSYFKSQPESVIKNFIYRWSYCINSYSGGKCIVNTDYINNDINLHLTNIKDNNLYVNFNGEFKFNEWFGECPDMNFNENIIKDMNIRINHYCIQSEEYFRNVKITRGDATVLNNIRDMNYFKNYDKNEVLDEILKKKYHKNEVLDEILKKNYDKNEVLDDILKKNYDKNEVLDEILQKI